MKNEDIDQGLINKEFQLIQYDDAYLAFIDVIGFKEIVQNDDLTLVSNYYDSVNEGISQLTDILQQFGTPSTQIMSDSIVFIVKPKNYDLDSKINCLRALCGSISHLQFSLSIQGIWTRGGISYGKIKFHDDKFIVGPAMIRAVELEQVAKFPRVIIEPKILLDLNVNKEKLLQLLHANLTDAQWIYPYYTGKGSDFEDFLFINFGVMLGTNFKFAVQSANKIAQHLKKGLYGSPIHAAKYRWLNEYFKSLPMSEGAAKFFAGL